MYRIRTIFNGMQGAPWLSTMYFAEGGGTALQAANAVAAFWAAVDNLIDSEVNWEIEDDVSLINAANGQLTGVTSIAAGSGSGSAVGDALPAASQALVRWRTGIIVAGRELRGRTFIPALVEASNDNGQLLAASSTTIGSAALTLRGDANSDFVVWSRANGVAHSVVADSVWASFAQLRSRRD